MVPGLHDLTDQYLRNAVVKHPCFPWANGSDHGSTGIGQSRFDYVAGKEMAEEGLVLLLAEMGLLNRYFQMHLQVPLAVAFGAGASYEGSAGLASYPFVDSLGHPSTTEKWNQI